MVSIQPMEAPSAMFLPHRQASFSCEGSEERDQAREAIGAFLDTVANPEEVYAKISKTPLADMLATYNRFQPVGKSALHDRQHALKLLADTMQVEFVEDVNKAVAIEFSEALLEDGTRTRATIRKLQAKLKSFWGWMVDNEFVPSNPFNKALVKSEPTIETRLQRRRTESRSRATGRHHEGRLPCPRGYRSSPGRTFLAGDDRRDGGIPVGDRARRQDTRR